MEAKQKIAVMQRGVGGIVKGQSVTYTLSDGKKIQKVTDMVTGTGSVVRSVSPRELQVLQGEIPRRVSMSKDFRKLNADLGAEFDRYVAEHPAWAQKHIPRGAKIALQMEGNAAFNSWSRQLAKRTRSENQSVVFVRIEKLAPVRSRIIKATVLKAA